MALVGNLEDLGLAEILQILNLSRKSGILHIQNSDFDYMLVFKGGQIISAFERNKKRHIGHALIERGIMKVSEFNNLVEVYKEKGQKNETLKEFIIRKTDIPRELIEDAVVEEVEEVMFRVFAVKEGKFFFDLVEDDRELFKKLPKSLSYLDKGLNPQYLAIEAMRMREEAFKEIGEEKKKEEDQHFERLTFSELDSSFIDLEGGKDHLSTLRSFIYELLSPGETVDVSLMVLRFAGEFFRRAILFAPRKDFFLGIGAVAEGNSGITSESVREIKISMGYESILKEVYDNKRPVKRRLLEVEGDRILAEKLGGFEPSEAFAAPILVAGRVAAIIYCDNAPDSKEIGETNALEVFIIQAGLVMEKMLLERKVKGKLP